MSIIREMPTELTVSESLAVMGAVNTQISQMEKAIKENPTGLFAEMAKSYLDELKSARTKFHRKAVILNG